MIKDLIWVFVREKMHNLKNQLNLVTDLLRDSKHKEEVKNTIFLVLVTKNLMTSEES